jgi:hypothetical protein
MVPEMPLSSLTSDVPTSLLPMLILGYFLFPLKVYYMAVGDLNPRVKGLLARLMG